MNIQNHRQRALVFGNGAFKPVSLASQCPAKPCPHPASFSPIKFSPHCPLPSSLAFREESTISPISPVKPLSSPSEASSPKQNRGEKVRTGKWTPDEHKKFLEAMEAYGNSWDLVKEYIGTRSAAQIRSHAQKYYCGIRKREIKRLKNNPKAKRVVFVVTKEYLNTCGMGGYKRRTEAKGGNKEKVAEVPSCQQYTAPSAIESNKDIVALKGSGSPEETMGIQWKKELHVVEEAIH